jgi:hypothetical protein
MAAIAGAWAPGRGPARFKIQRGSPFLGAWGSLKILKMEISLFALFPNIPLFRTESNAGGLQQSKTPQHTLKPFFYFLVHPCEATGIAFKPKSPKSKSVQIAVLDYFPRPIRRVEIGLVQKPPFRGVLSTYLFGLIGFPFGRIPGNRSPFVQLDFWTFHSALATMYAPITFSTRPDWTNSLR